jgi:uncharacterized membrane protein
LPAVAIPIVFIALLDYLYWSTVGLPYIDGVHGRYLIPLSPAVAILLVASFAKLRIRFRLPAAHLNAATADFLTACCAYFYFLVWFRYWS